MKTHLEINQLFEKSMDSAGSDPAGSYAIAEKMLSTCKQNNDLSGMAKSYLLLAYSGQFLGLHAQAFENVHLALPIFKETEDYRNEAASYNTLGFIYYYFDEHEKRLEVNLKSLKIREKIEDTVGYARSLNNTGDTYLKLGNYKKALELFEKCNQLNFKNKTLDAVISNNIADAYLNLKNHNLALKNAEISLKCSVDLKINNLIFSNLHLKSEIFNNKSDWKQSIEQLKIALKYSSDLENFDENTSLMELYKSTSYAYEQIGDYINAMKCLKNHFKIDKLNQEKRNNKEIKNIQFRNEINHLQNKTSELELTIEERTRELEEALETEKNISFFTQELTNTNSLDEVLWKLVKSCISKLKLEDCVVYLIDSNENILIQKAAFGPKSPAEEIIKDPITIRIGDGIVGSVAASGNYELISDTTKDMRYIVDDDVRFSELAVPIFYENQVIGVIDSEHSQKDFFNERHLSIFKMLASLVQSRIGKLKEQEANQILQEKIIKINSTLEKQIKIKSRENTQLNHKILDQEKKAIIGEMSTIITHELNTPLATIKGGNEAILFLFNKLLNSNFLDFIQNEELNFLIKKTDLINHRIKKNISIHEQFLLSPKEIKILENKVKDKVLIQSIRKLNFIEPGEINEILKFKNLKFTLEFLKDIYTINHFSDVIQRSVTRANNVIEELKQLAQYEDNPEKQKISLIKNFEGLQVHTSLSHPEAKFIFDVDEDHFIYGNEFRTIQLWSNILHLIIENCNFKGRAKFILSTKSTGKKMMVTIECSPNSVLTELFNKNILNYRFHDDIDSSIKLRLNIIHTILIEHRSKLRCNYEDNYLLFELTF
ncbi:MAG: GAF domain-containing protein [Flavobacteriales bacterium]|nr:MAG: GAF domain-containing protein [Flavobacteriales bacterium]